MTAIFAASAEFAPTNSGSATAAASMIRFMTVPLWFAMTLAAGPAPRQLTEFSRSCVRWPVLVCVATSPQIVSSPDDSCDIVPEKDEFVPKRDDRREIVGRADDLARKVYTDSPFLAWAAPCDSSRRHNTAPKVPRPANAGRPPARPLLRS